MGIAGRGCGARPATEADFERLLEVLLGAFAVDPVHLWMFPDQASRRRRQTRLFRRVLSIYARSGAIWTTDDLAGAALWEPPRHDNPTISQFFDFALSVVPVFGCRALTVVRGMAPLATLHPQEPHWYLAILGSQPSRQRSGVGRALLQPVLRRCDDEGLPAYLEASREENIGYYERYGFELIAPYALPRGPSVYRMVRAPR